MLSADDAEAYLASLEPIGWKLGLRRMQALCEELGNPQRRYTTVHVVGTNGKTSVCRLFEGLMSAGGIPAGSSVSPHLGAWRERINVGGNVLPAADFARATARVAEAAAAVDRSLGESEGRLTQFEVATAIAFFALAEAGVEVAAIEAGLGGRLDASNVIESSLTVLTSVGLDHTEWLGDTVEAIAAEKLAVLRPGTALIVGPTEPSILELARLHARQERAELIPVSDGESDARLRGRFRRIDFELAWRAAQYVQGQMRPDDEASLLGDDRAAAIAAEIEVPGRLEVWPGQPTAIFDVAHNPQGAAALAEALDEVRNGQPILACIAVLADKDAEAIVAALAPALQLAICTELSQEQLRGSGKAGASSHPAADLARSFQRRGVTGEVVADPVAALARLRALALERESVALVTGSHFLVALARDRRLWHH